MYRTPIMSTQKRWIKEKPEEYKLVCDCLHALMHVSLEKSDYKKLIVDLQGDLFFHRIIFLDAVIYF